MPTSTSILSDDIYVSGFEGDMVRFLGADRELKDVSCARAVFDGG